MTDEQVAKTNTEIAKLIAETAKINTENKLYPVIVLATIVGGAAALITAIAGAMRVLA